MTNTRKLWQYTCKPNQPIGRACIIFTTYKDTSLLDARALAKQYVEGAGGIYAGVNEQLYFLGMLTTNEVTANPVIYAFVGEY